MNIIDRIAEKYIPDLLVHSLKDIDFAYLKKKGIKGIILDLDNTVLPWKDYSVPKSSLEWIEKGKSMGMVFFILSNTVHTKRLFHIARTLGCEFIHPAFKPNPFGYKRAAKKMGLDTHEIACVGDQIFTDIKGGKSAGFFTILTDPLDTKEFKGTKISRFFEKIIKKHWKNVAYNF